MSMSFTVNASVLALLSHGVPSNWLICFQKLLGFDLVLFFFLFLLNKLQNYALPSPCHFTA